MSMEGTFSVDKPFHLTILRGLWMAALVLITATLLAQQPPAPALSRRPDTKPQQPPAPSLPSRVDPKAQQLIDRTIRALGGQAFLNSKTLTTKGRVYSIQDETTAGLA